MTDEQIILVKKSWKLFRDIDHILVGDTFYSKLFAENPSLRKMFPQDMKEQYEKLIDMVSTLVARLGHRDHLTDELTALARRHVQYGVRPAHYRLVGRALLWTLQQGLGNDWTEEINEAWTKCYNILADTMIAASSPEHL